MTLANQRPGRNFNTAPANEATSLLGRRVVRRRDGARRRCQHCGATTGVIGPGCGPHLFELRCTHCGRGLCWLGRGAAERLKGGPLSAAELAERRPAPARKRSDLFELASEGDQ
jgi:hypothetical protein